MNLTTTDINRIRQNIVEAQEDQVEQIIGYVIPAIEAADITLSHQIDDLCQDAAMGFAEVHSKLDELRQELTEVKQRLNNLYPWHHVIHL